MSETQVYYRPPRYEYKRLLREDSEARKADWDTLSTMEKIAVLDSRLGPNVGAVKQRARLKAQLEAECEAKEKKQRVKEVEDKPKKSAKPKKNTKGKKK